MKKRKLIVKLMAFALAMFTIFSLCACAKTDKPEKPPKDDSDKGDDNVKPDDNKDPENKPDPEVKPEPEKPSDDFYTLEAQNNPRNESCIPDFTDKQKEKQKKKGHLIAAQITQAANDLTKSEFTIPKGDYGFDMTNVFLDISSIPFGFGLRDIKRPDDKPFTVHAEGVTFWMEVTGKPCANTSMAFFLYNCSNIEFVGLTIDEYTPNDIEGTVSKIDRKNNRIAIKLTNSSMTFDTKLIPTIISGSQFRIVPYKASGEHIAPLYKIEPNAWGPGDMWLKDIQPTGNENEYWITFKNDRLLKKMYDPSWKATYGKAGMIEENDVLSILYGNITVEIGNCKQIHMIGLQNHMTKGMPAENGGYGNHLWKDCYFGPRKGSSKVMTAGEYMLQGTRHGSTLDNVYLASSSDDQINIHGFWAKPHSVSGKTVSMQYLINGALKGDKAEIYDKDGNFIQSATVAEDVKNHVFHGIVDVKFEENIKAIPEGSVIRFPSLECDGWVIKNCTFMNNYQRILIQSGSGTFENNKVYNMGSPVAVDNNTYSYEGGVLGDMVFRNNIFYNSSNSPSSPLFAFAQTPHWDKKILGGNIEITDNIMVNCGQLLKAINMKSVTFSRNTVVDPLIYPGNKYTDFRQLKNEIRSVSDLDFSGNTLYSSFVEENNTDKSENRTIKIDKTLAERVSFYTNNTPHSVKETIDVLTKHLKDGK